MSNTLYERPLPHGTLTGATGRYRIVAQIGAPGGSGVVYRADDVQAGTSVALKICHGHLWPQARVEVIREALLLKEISCQKPPGYRHVIAYLDSFEVAPSPFFPSGTFVLVMELADGSLADVIRDGLRRRVARAVMADVIEGTRAVHRFGVHNDLKPLNVLRTPSGFKVADLSITRLLIDKTHTRFFGGADGYMAPERLRGETRKESDIYNLGCLYYELLVGQLPEPGHRLARRISVRDRRLITACLRSAYAERPTLEKLARQFPPSERSRERMIGRKSSKGVEVASDERPGSLAFEHGVLAAVLVVLALVTLLVNEASIMRTAAQVIKSLNSKALIELDPQQDGSVAISGPPRAGPGMAHHGPISLSSDGGVFTEVPGGFRGSLANVPHFGRPVSIAATPDGGGYWIAASDGGVYAFGNASFYGSRTDPLQATTQPVVAITATPTGRGYWLLDGRGNVHAYGDATYLGGYDHHDPVYFGFVGMAATASGRGYWIVNSSGSLYSFGDATFYGRPPDMHGSNLWITGIAPTSSHQGYWVLRTDGTVLSFGDASFIGLLPARWAKGIAATTGGYDVVTRCGVLASMSRGDLPPETHATGIACGTASDGTSFGVEGIAVL